MIPDLIGRSLLLAITTPEVIPCTTSLWSRLDEERSRARFALPGRQEWNAQHISDLIEVLAQIREEMTPAVSEEPPPVHEPLHNPRYATELHPFSGGTLLELRHPSLGWLEFVLPSLERRRSHVSWTSRNRPGSGTAGVEVALEASDDGYDVAIGFVEPGGLRVALALIIIAPIFWSVAQTG